MLLTAADFTLNASFSLGKVPTVGLLVGLSREETVIEVHGSAGTVRCHFPRLEYAVEPAGPAVSKL